MDNNQQAAFHHAQKYPALLAEILTIVHEIDSERIIEGMRLAGVPEG